MELLTTEQRETLRLQLCTEYKCDVQDWSFDNGKFGQVLCFAKEPTIEQVYAGFDRMLISATSAGAVLMECVIIKEHSDPRIFSTESKNNAIILRINMKCQDLIEIATDEIKKK